MRMIQRSVSNFHKPHKIVDFIKRLVLITYTDILSKIIYLLRYAQKQFNINN